MLKTIDGESNYAYTLIGKINVKESEKEVDDKVMKWLVDYE